MSSIGIIYCAYDAEDQIDRSLNLWKVLRAEGQPFHICAVSMQFEGFEKRSNEATLEVLNDYYKLGVIDRILTSEEPKKETEARAAALHYLVEEKSCDIVLLVDADEIMNLESYLNIFKFVKENPFIPCFRLCYKNLVFSTNQYLAEPFTPPRIFRTNIKVSGQDFKIAGFRDDNNVYYKNNDKPPFILPDSDLPWTTIPQNLAWIPHETWLNDLRSKRKCRYQEKRWAHPRGFGCSFAWDAARGGLVFNEKYYELIGQPLPKVITENA